MTPRLVRTEAVVEGRVEQRWTLVEDDDTPEYDPEHPPAVVGHPATRLTAAARLSGSARYTSDIAPPGTLQALVLRSPHAHARVTSIDLEAARAVDGVRVVVGPDDGPQFEGADVLTVEPGYAGAAVAALAADSPRAAARGLEALAPVYEELPFLVDMEQALDAQQLVEEPTEYERGDADAALAAADVVVVAAEYAVAAQMHNSMEPHCAVAEWRGDDLTVWSSTQGDLRGPLAARPLVRRGRRAGAGDLRVHGRRVRLEGRLRPRGHPRRRPGAPQRPRRAAGLLPP